MADRNRRTNAHVPAATMVLAVLLTAGSARGQLYQLVELSSLGGGLSSPEAINQQGIVVGRSRTAAGSDRAVRWNLAGQVQDLGALGGSGGVAYGVSNTGVIVGSARNGFNVDEAFVWDEVNGMRAVPGLPMSTASYAQGVNDEGSIVGILYNSVGLDRAFRVSPSGVVSEPYTDPAIWSGAMGINQGGTIVGYRLANAGSTGGLYWPSQSPAQLASGAQWLVSVNDAGVAVGWGASVLAVRWTPGSGNAFTVPAGSITPKQGLAINNTGVIVGRAIDSANRDRAFIYTDRAGTQNLNQFVSMPAGWVLTSATGINDFGVIAAVATSPLGVTRAVTLTPPQTGAVVYVDADAPAGGSGSNWASALRSLHDALVLASLNPGVVEEVWVAEGEYRPAAQAGGSHRDATFLVPSGVNVYGGFAGTETTLAERQWELHPTVLSGDLGGNDGPNFTNTADNCNTVVRWQLTPASPPQVFDGFGVTAAFETGMRVIGGDLTVRNLRAFANEGSGAGAVMSQFGRITIEDCLFESNRSRAGAAAVEIETNAVSPGIVRNSIIRNNTALVSPAGVQIGGSFPGAIIGCLVEGNSASQGSAAGARASLVINSIIRGNNRGGVSAGQLINCVVSGNTGPAPGAEAQIMVMNCTIVQNTSTGVTGGLWMGQPTTVVNSIIWGNAGNGIPGEAWQIGGNASGQIRHSCVQSFSGLTGPGPVLTTDPFFVDLDGPDGIPGNADDDLRLTRPQSPCIDAGDTPSLPEDAYDLDNDGDVTEPLPWDLMRGPRVIEDPVVPNTGVGPGAVDLGAIETAVPACYVNCDQSTAPPVLNVADFGCFLNQFAAGTAYANCDGSTQEPVLNVADFSCFLTRFAAGCP